MKANDFRSRNEQPSPVSGYRGMRGMVLPCSLKGGAWPVKIPYFIPLTGIQVTGSRPCWRTRPSIWRLPDNTLPPGIIKRDFRPDRAGMAVRCSVFVGVSARRLPSREHGRACACLLMRASRFAGGFSEHFPVEGSVRYRTMIVKARRDCATDSGAVQKRGQPFRGVFYGGNRGW